MTELEKLIYYIYKYSKMTSNIEMYTKILSTTKKHFADLGVDHCVIYDKSPTFFARQNLFISLFKEYYCDLLHRTADSFCLEFGVRDKEMNFQCNKSIDININDQETLEKYLKYFVLVLKSHYKL